MVNSGTILLYEINPALEPQLPSSELSSKSDSNYSISEDWTKTVLYMMTAQRNQYSSYVTIKPNNIPRIMWINKNWSLYEVHLEVFRFFRHSFSQMFKTPNGSAPFKKQSIDENENGTPLTLEEYESLSLEDAF